MRIVHTFIYNGGKTFRAGELTVGDYYTMQEDAPGTLHRILGEFNESVPVLSDKHLVRFISILMGNNDPLESFKKKKRDDLEHDFHIQIGMFIAYYHVNPDALPLSLFNKLLKDINIISGKDEYKPRKKGQKDGPDKAGFRKVANGSGVLYSTPKGK